MEAPSLQDVVRFGLFELDLQARQLSKNGNRIRLAQQPLQVLAILLERSGEIVTREELRQSLWNADIFVDFDHGLNKAVQKIREAIGDSAESPRFIETIPRVGYRFIAPVNLTPRPQTFRAVEVGPEPPALLPIPPQDLATGTAGIGPQRWRLIFFCIVLAVVLGSTGLFYSHRVATRPIHSLAVLPLENLSGDPSQEYFSDGMTDQLITELARIPALRVVSRTSVMQEKHSHRPVGQIARDLDVDAIVEGSVVRSGDKIRITAQLIDARTDKHLWADSFETAASDILTVQDSVAREIASQAKVVLTPVSEGSSGPIHINPAALDAVLRGRYFLQKRDARQSAIYFKQAISIDPSYASAFAGLALSLQSEVTLDLVPPGPAMEEGLKNAAHAIQLGPEDGPSYTALGGIQSMLEWNWIPAGQNLSRGLALSPSDSYAELQYAGYLDAMNRPEEAANHMRRALQLDPLSFFMNRQLASTLYYARHYDEALLYLQRAREMEPSKTGLIDIWASWIYQQKGLRDEAIQYDLSELRSSRPGIDLSALQSAYRQHGWHGYWRTRAEAVETSASNSCKSWELGESYVRAGEIDRAFLNLDEAISQRCFWVMWLPVDPSFDEIRSDARFPALLQRMHLSRKPGPSS